jgi:hypothetical protein
MKKNLVLKSYDTRAVFENIETGSCLMAIQLSSSASTSGAAREFKVMERIQLPDLGIPAQVTPIEAIFGIYDLLSGSYAAVVTESESYVSTPQMNVRKVKKILLIQLFQNARTLSGTKQSDERKYIELLHRGFAEHNFFFSFVSDITLTQQTLHKAKTVAQASKPLWVRADTRFFWNKEIVMDLIACEADQWIIPFMSAYIEVRPECEVEDEKFTLLFISRRSRFRQGCRFTKRGIDMNGNTANFVETEQILLFPSGKISSFVQIRGSIPFFWSSPVLMKYDPHVYIDTDRPRSIEIAKKHCSELLEKYSDDGNNGSIVFVSLVDNKRDQGKLGVVFKEVIDAVSTHFAGASTLTYIWFDFHHECSQKGKWSNLSKLVAMVHDKFVSQKYFCKQASGVITSWQTGVLRTNCMDNLDRTNVVQSLFARRSLVIQLGKSVNGGGGGGGNGGSVLDTPWKSFEKIYKTVWVNNADAMSFAYAGTGALKVDFTKTGKRTYKGMIDDGWNACLRYYINNFTDGEKQDAIDLMLGNYKPDHTAPTPFVRRPKQESLSDNVIKLFVVMVVTFFSLVLLTPHAHTAGMTFITANNSLSKHLCISLYFTVALTVYLLFLILKKGSTIGERIVVHPRLVKEPIITLSQQKNK